MIVVGQESFGLALPHARVMTTLVVEIEMKCTSDTVEDEQRRDDRHWDKQQNVFQSIAQ